MYCHRYATLDPIMLETLLIECAEDVIYEQIPDVAVSQSSGNIVAVSGNVSYGCNRNYLAGACFTTGSSGASQVDGEILEYSDYEN